MKRTLGFSSCLRFLCHFCEMFYQTTKKRGRSLQMIIVTGMARRIMNQYRYMAEDTKQQVLKSYGESDKLSNASIIVWERKKLSCMLPGVTRPISR